MIEKITLKGTHGTNKPNATLIAKNGFHPKSGRIGTGAYFWSTDLGYEYELAEAWVKSKFQNENSGVVLYCDINVEEDSLIDIENMKLKLAVLEIAKKYNPNGTYTNQTLCAIHDLFIREYEKKKKCSIHVIMGKTAAPHKDCFSGDRIYPTSLLGAPITYAVRKMTLISVVEQMEFSL